MREKVEKDQYTHTLYTSSSTRTWRDRDTLPVPEMETTTYSAIDYFVKLHIGGGLNLLVLTSLT